MAALITELISDPDNVERIRDQIGAILALECNNQKALALYAGAEDADDFDIGVYIENSRPWDLSGKRENAPFPLVNVLLEKTTGESGSSPVDKQKFTAVFSLDCYGCGNLAGGQTDDQQAARKAWKLARVIRNIISAGEYTYLGLQKVGDEQCVCSRKIVKMTAGVNGNMSAAAQAIIVCRIDLAVTYYELSHQASGIPMENMTFRCEDSTGQVLIDI